MWRPVPKVGSSQDERKRLKLILAGAASAQKSVTQKC